jgi:hypothetical protein
MKMGNAAQQNSAEENDQGDGLETEGKKRK